MLAFKSSHYYQDLIYLQNVNQKDEEGNITKYTFASRIDMLLMYIEAAEILFVFAVIEGARLCSMDAR